jgi:hypothetical protein
VAGVASVAVPLVVEVPVGPTIVAVYVTTELEKNDSVQVVLVMLRWQAPTPLGLASSSFVPSIRVSPEKMVNSAGR